MALRARGRLHGAEGRGADGADVASRIAGFIDDGAGLLGDDDLLTLHLVLREVLYVDVTVVPQPVVHGDEGLVDVADLHAQQQLAAEVEARR